MLQTSRKSKAPSGTCYTRYFSWLCMECTILDGHEPVRNINFSRSAHAQQVVDFPVQSAHAQPEFMFTRWMWACATVLSMSCSGSCHFASATHRSKIVHSVRVSRKNIFHWNYHEFDRYFKGTCQPYWVSHLEFWLFNFRFVISYPKSLGIPNCSKKYTVKVTYWVVSLIFYGNMVAIFDQPSRIHNIW